MSATITSVAKSNNAASLPNQNQNSIEQIPSVLKVVIFCALKQLPDFKSAFDHFDKRTVTYFPESDFLADGVSRFRALPGSHPKNGTIGKVSGPECEAALEMVITKDKLDQFLKLIKDKHDYNVPGIDAYPYTTWPHEIECSDLNVVITVPAEHASLFETAMANAGAGKLNNDGPSVFKTTIGKYGQARIETVVHQQNYYAMKMAIKRLDPLDRVTIELYPVQIPQSTLQKIKIVAFAPSLMSASGKYAVATKRPNGMVGDALEDAGAGIIGNKEVYSGCMFATVATIRKYISNKRVFDKQMDRIESIVDPSNLKSVLDSLGKLNLDIHVILYPLIDIYKLWNL